MSYEPLPPVEPLAPAPVSAAPDRKWMAITSLVLGILSLCAWFFPICGFPFTIAGIIFGALAFKTPSRNLAIAGLVLSVIGLCLTIGNAAFGAYLGLTGQFDPSKLLQNLPK